MISRHWDLLYGRPPARLDAILMGAAFLLHLPLLLLSIRGAPKFGAKAPGDFQRPVRVNTILTVPPVIVPQVPKAFDLKKLLGRSGVKPVAPLPALPPPGPGPDLVSPPSPTAPAPIRQAPAAPTLSRTLPRLAAPGLPAPVATQGTGIGTGPSAQSSIAISPSPAWAVGHGRIEGVGGGAGAGPAVRVPTAEKPRAQEGILSARRLSAGAGPEDGPKAATVDAARDAGGLIRTEKPGEAGALGEVRVPLMAAGGPRAKRPLFPITGPLANREIKYQELPEYPAALRQKGVEGTVVIRFTVLPDGRVKDNVEVVTGSGYTEFDSAAERALLRWIFAELPRNVYKEEIGTVTIRFTLK